MHPDGPNTITFDGSRRFKLLRVPAWVVMRLMTQKLSDVVRDGKVTAFSTDLPKDVVCMAVGHGELTNDFLLRLWHPSWPVMLEGAVLERVDVRFTAHYFDIDLEKERSVDHGRERAALQRTKANPEAQASVTHHEAHQFLIKQRPDGRWEPVDKGMPVPPEFQWLLIDDFQKTQEAKARQFVVRFRCGCCVRFAEHGMDQLGNSPNRNNREHAKCDMANGCFYDEKAVQTALEKRVSSDSYMAGPCVSWSWEENA